MKDIPMFATQYGVASLFLQEVSYRQRAHIKLQATEEPEKLLSECIGFCRACGADWCDASGHAMLEKYPRLATLVQMRAERRVLAENTATLVTMTEETEEQWRRIYNEKMQNVPNCAYLDTKGCKELGKSGGCRFVYEGERLLGIGSVDGCRIETVAACVPGGGEKVVRALACTIESEQVELTVALENQKAVRLYERLGFQTVRELSRWYRVL